jgi:hypothetical protein
MLRIERQPHPMGSRWHRSLQPERERTAAAEANAGHRRRTVGGPSGTRSLADALRRRRRGSHPTRCDKSTRRPPPGAAGGKSNSDFQNQCQAPHAKIFRWSRRANQWHESRIPARKRGVSRSSRCVGWAAMDVFVQVRGSMIPEKWIPVFRQESCSNKDARRRLDEGVRRSRVVLAPRCWRQAWREVFRKVTVTTSPLTGESAI